MSEDPGCCITVAVGERIKGLCLRQNDLRLQQLVLQRLDVPKFAQDVRWSGGSVPWKGLFAANYMPYPAGQPDSNKPTTPFVPKTRATVLTTPAPPSRRTLPVQPSELKYEQQYCYECSVVVDGRGRLVTSNSTKKAFDDKDVVFPAGNKKCFSESKQSLSQFEGTGLCPANSVCGVEFIEERVNSSKEGLLRR